MKVLRKKFSESKKQISKVIYKTGQATTKKQGLLRILRDFYSELYRKTVWREAVTGIPKVQNGRSEDIPDITWDKINNCLKDLKNNKSRKDEIIAKKLKLGQTALILVSALSKLWNLCILISTTPDQCIKAIIIMQHNKADIAQI